MFYPKGSVLLSSSVLVSLLCVRYSSAQVPKLIVAFQSLCSSISLSFFSSKKAFHLFRRVPRCRESGHVGRGRVPGGVGPPAHVQRGDEGLLGGAAEDGGGGLRRGLRGSGGVAGGGGRVLPQKLQEWKQRGQVG